MSYYMKYHAYTADSFQSIANFVENRMVANNFQQKNVKTVDVIV